MQPMWKAFWESGKSQETREDTYKREVFSAQQSPDGSNSARQQGGTG